MTDHLPGRLSPEEEVLYVYRKLVYVLYLEIGALQPKIHAEIAARADLRSAFFQRDKERHAAQIYHRIERETDPALIEAPYQQRTGLTLEDIHQAFAEGDWKNKFGQFTFGGPKWEHIAKLTLELRGLIQKREWEDASALVYEIKKLKTNQGYLVNQFERSERRRPENSDRRPENSDRRPENSDRRPENSDRRPGNTGSRSEGEGRKPEGGGRREGGKRQEGGPRR